MRSTSLAGKEICRSKCPIKLPLPRVSSALCGTDKERYNNHMIEKEFDIPFIADLALREKQIQQNYRPVIAVHKWFARRPGIL